MADNSLLLTKITFAMAEITFKVAVIPSSVAKITFVVAVITFRVAVITSSVTKIIFLWPRSLSRADIRLLVVKITFVVAVLDNLYCDGDHFSSVQDHFCSG